MKSVMGIDPGLSGGIALIIGNEEIKISKVLPTPCKTVEIRKGHFAKRIDEIEISKIFHQWDSDYGIDEVWIEKQIVVKGQGIISSATTIEGYGIYKGICAGIKLPYNIVRAQTWQKELKVDVVNNTKIESIKKAKELFPDINLKRTKTSRKDSDGLSDALLIAYYGFKLDG